MLSLSIYLPTATYQQPAFITAEPVSTLRLLLQEIHTYKNFHSKPQISNISPTEVPVVVPEVKINPFPLRKDVFHMLAMKSFAGDLWDEPGH